jgi:hypothetical protein
MGATMTEAATRDRRRFAPALGPLESRLAPMGCAAAPAELALPATGIPHVASPVRPPAEHDPMGCPPPSSVGG